MAASPVAVDAAQPFGMRQDQFPVPGLDFSDGHVLSPLLPPSSPAVWRAYVRWPWADADDLAAFHLATFRLTVLIQKAVAVMRIREDRQHPVFVEFSTAQRTFVSSSCHFDLCHLSGVPLALAGKKRADAMASPEWIKSNRTGGSLCYAQGDRD